MARKNKTKKENKEFTYPTNDSTTKLVIAVSAKNAGQKKALKAISENKVTFLYGVAGSGKAQPLDSLVYTPFGPVCMGDVKIGDEVCTPNGVAKIIGVYPQGLKDVYKVICDDGASVECCEEHLWTVYDRAKRVSSTKSLITTELKNLRDNLRTTDGRLRYALPVIEPVHFEAQNVLMEPYLVGLLLGDGSLSNSNVILTSVDQEIVNYVLTTVDDKYELKVCSDDISYRIVRKDINRHTNHYKDLLKKYGIWGKTAYQKSIPNEYLYNCYDDRIALLQGLMDSDGGVTREGQAEFYTSSEVLAKQVKWLADSLGGVASIRAKNPSYICKNEKRIGVRSYTVLLGLNDDSIAFRLPRKKMLCKPRTKYFAKRRIAAVEFVGKKECQCIMIDDDKHLYLTNDLVPTHNTHCAVGWGVQELIKGTYDRIVFTRPYVEAGEKLGYLPGGSGDKFAPFTMPLYEVVSDYLSNDDMKALMDEKRIVVYPMAYMRGITFKKSYVIADEVQNTSPQQMRMMLTRIGEGSKIVCTGDVEQSDIGSKLNGLADAINRLQDIQDLAFVELDYSSCVRDKIVADIDQRYKDGAYARVNKNKAKDPDLSGYSGSETQRTEEYD
jgi:phosphate starvation-inducible protein PhoH